MTASGDSTGQTGGLRERFERFIRGMPGFESVDDLLRDRNPQGKRRADYLLHQRSVIVEQKVLEVDPGHKGQRLLDKVMEERKIVAYGLNSANVILKGRPDAEAINRKLFQKLTQVIEANVSSADKQTCDTKSIFGLKEAGGLLVILNEAAPTLDPNIVCHRISHLISARLPDGQLRYPHNQVAMYIQESHSLRGQRGDLIPIAVILGPEWKNALQVEWIATEVMKGWSAFNGRPFVEGPDDPSILVRLRRRDTTR